MRLYDIRAGHDAITAATIPAHRNPATSVCWAPNNGFQLVSASQENFGCLKVWDVRSRSTPLLSVKCHDDAILAVDWPTAQLIISGGTDSFVKVLE